ncbi:NAD(P)H-dependent oxidoreductase [Kallipyga massiliensis]|uniref:NAD(P)H-dependent oxidoreductase n=1 Tax=Kallipyga massiliensis TaxID=1472764 RepID=UPI0026F049C5|nr:Gfo/Idh/MocA family oxidoreductase [Kallipyga massiliensis]
MARIYEELLKLENENRPICLGIIGAGQMGQGMVAQLSTVPGMVLTGICDHNQDRIDKAVENYKNLSGKARTIVQDTDFRAICRSHEVDVVVDATGTTEGGADIAQECLREGKHLVLLNVEVDVTIGPLMHKLFKEAGLIYTGSNGDEPAETFQLFEFAKTMGMEVLVAGKGKNNKIDFGANPETCREEAEARGMNPRMLASFKDGTKTMAEMNLLANATGFLPDVPGMHGISGGEEETLKTFRTKDEGGILSRYGVVDYVDGLAPGVFVIAKPQNAWVREELSYMMKKDGDHFLFYRPFHLGSLETPITIAKAFLQGQMAITPLPGGPVAETVCVAKKDLEAGEELDGIGGFCLRGLLESHEDLVKGDHVPLGIVAGQSKMARPVKAGQVLTREDVDLDTTTTIYKLRAQQDDAFARELGDING